MEPDRRLSRRPVKCFVRRENGREISQSESRCFYTGPWRHPCRNAIIQRWLINAGLLCDWIQYKNTGITACQWEADRMQDWHGWQSSNAALLRDSVRLFPPQSRVHNCGIHFMRALSLRVTLRIFFGFAYYSYQRLIKNDRYEDPLLLALALPYSTTGFLYY